MPEQPKPPATPDALIRRIRVVAERAGWRITHSEVDGAQVRIHADPPQDETTEE
jgi:hypothetical protein